jgi:uncharacterized protein
MEFEWDESKRRANILKHGIDFVDVLDLFDGPLLELPDRRRDYGEARFLVTGQAGGRILRIVYTWRGERRRLISARPAGRNDRRAYYEGLAGTGEKDEK